MGVKLALDDFGTGYSSMASLHAFPLDTVKIDRSFIQRLAENEDAVSIVGAIIAMSKSLRMDVTGEGVETEDHVAQLQGLGCTLGQGYFFSRPVPPQHIDILLPGLVHESVNKKRMDSKESIEQYLWSLQSGADAKKAA